jgi:hypothetical protein
VPLTQIPMAFVYLGCWFLMAGIVYYFTGFETGTSRSKRSTRNWLTPGFVDGESSAGMGLDTSSWIR